jgi:hypothetical protein
MKLKRPTLVRKVNFNGKMVTVYFEYWPAYPATQYSPAEGPEINIIMVNDENGKGVDIQMIPDDDNGISEYDELTNILFDVLSCEYSCEEME